MTSLTRQALYDLVWSKPVATVASELNICGAGLKKICARADIPVPQRGYWARLAAGKFVMKTDLPLRAPGMSDIALNRSQSTWRWLPDPAAELAEPEPVEPVFEETLESVEARIRKSVRKVASVRPLTDAHPQIRRLLDEDEARRQRQAASRYSFLSDTPMFDSPFEQRRLRILNSLFLGLTRVGAKPSPLGRAARQVHVHIGSQGLSIHLDHPNAKEARWGEEKVYGGKVDTLRLSIPALENEAGRTCVWTDTDDVRLESQLTEISVMLFLAAEIEYRRGAEHTYKHTMKKREEARIELARRRAEAERQERERQAKLEQQRRDHLKGLARDWREANDIRAFLSVVRQMAGCSPKVDQWVAWASDVADRLDPFADKTFLEQELS